MNTGSYNFIIRNRPIKTAFVVNLTSENINEQLFSIFEYCHSIWGGLYNQIILLEENDIKNKWWELLNAYDPDIIYSFEDLSEALVFKIDTYLSPFLIEKIEEIRNIHYKDLNIFPNKKNILRNKLVLFKSQLYEKNEENNVINNFLKTNFGIYKGLYGEEKIIEEIPKEIFEIKEKNDLISAFEKLSDYKYSNYHCKYLSQFCGIPYYYIPESSFKNSYRGAINVFIGDSPIDIVNFWNSSILTNSYLRELVHKLWIPTSLLKDENFLKAISRWIGIYSDVGDNSARHHVNFHSCSIPEEELRNIVSKIRENSKPGWFHSSVKIQSEPIIPDFPEYRINEIPNLSTSDWDYHKLPVELCLASAKEVCVSTKEPELSVFNSDKCYMCDIFIPLIDEKYRNFDNVQPYLKLPKRNSVAHQIFGRGSRINRDKYPSKIRKFGNPLLEFNLPQEEDLFKSLIRDKCGIYEWKYPDKKDLRSKLKTENDITKIRPSDKGKYLNGFISSFGNLKEASHIIKDSYWDKIFKILSGIVDKQEISSIEEVSNKISKKIQEIEKDFLNTQEGIEFLIRMITHQSQKFPINGKGIKYKTLYDEATTLYEKHISEEAFQEEMKRHNWTYKFDEIRLKEEINSLLERNILLLGVTSSCDNCGTKNWTHVNNLTQHIKCSGCQVEYTIKAEENWNYKLNTLIESGYRQFDLVPVVLALNELFTRSHIDFLYTNSLEIYLNRTKKPYTDLDIVCVKDGEFIIGEVKKSQKDFKPKDFEKMEYISKIIKPDKLIFSALDIINHETTLNKCIEENVNRLIGEFKPYGIKVSVHGFGCEPIEKNYHSFVDIDY